MPSSRTPASPSRTEPQRRPGVVERDLPHRADPAGAEQRGEGVPVEVGDSWRTLETVAVLGVWAVVGAVLTPVVLRRMSRRSTGSQVQAAKEAAVQWVR